MWRAWLSISTKPLSTKKNGTRAPPKPKSLENVGSPKYFCSANVPPRWYSTTHNASTARIEWRDQYRMGACCTVSI